VVHIACPSTRPRSFVLLKDGLRMSAREPGSLSRANGAQLVVDHFLRGWRLMKKKKRSSLEGLGKRGMSSKPVISFDGREADASRSKGS